jgi:hypothetical protein
LTPLTLITLCFKKLVPVTVNRTGPPPAGVDAGEILVSDGVTGYGFPSDPRGSLMLSAT